MKRSIINLLFSLTVLCYMSSVQAQAQFSDPKYIISTLPVYTPNSIYSIDLDGDGDMDVLSATSNNKIVWYENDGSGIFGAQQVITTSAYSATSVHAADLDGDGDMDVLSASYKDNKIAWYENDGSGGFGDQQVITSSANGASSVYAADFDGDGDMDVLSAAFYSPSGESNIAWYENDGSGSFETKDIAISTTGAQKVYASDLDNDGDMDVLAAFSCNWDTDMIAWYENDGTGRFAAQQVITISVHGAKSVYTSDLDGDGDMDVLSASTHIFEGKIAWCENDGSGNFGEQKVISTSALGAVSVCAFDLDGDNDMDVLSASYGDYKIAWYENDGSGSFGEQNIISNSARGEWGGCVYASDLDGDGDMDVLSASSGNFKISWHENDGSGNFEDHEVTTKPASIYGVTSVYASDLDSDGDMDVLSASEDDDKIAWYENDGTGNFKNQQVISTFADQGQSVYASDLDGDGDMDVLSASLNDSKIAWYENDGFGSFGDQKVITTSALGAVSVCAFDLDGDADMDVLCANSWDRKISWYENDGSGSFAEKVITSSAWGPRSVYASDLDSDGDMDVLSASYRDHKIAWYENDGSGSFGPQQVITTSAYGARSVYAADLDGDGDPDVLSASYNDSKIAWYENDGSGSFGPQQVITTSAWGAQSVLACNLDNDGDMDVISASFYDDKIAWYENDGSGSFDDFLISASAEGARSVYACDLDGDGDLDVMAAYNCSYGGRIAWYENLMGSTGIKNKTEKPVNFTLMQNYPNPFNPATKIRYSIPANSHVKLKIYDVLGHEVKTLVDKMQPAGNYRIGFNGAELASGVYVYSLLAGKYHLTKKMLLVK